MISSVLGISILVLPLSLVSIISRKWLLSDAWCRYQAFLFTVFIVTSMLSLAMISIDRHCAITNSLRYPYVFTQTRCNVIIGLGWLVGFSLALPPLFNTDLYGYEMVQFRCGVRWNNSGHNTAYLAAIVAVCYLLPMIVMMWCYCSIFRAAIKHMRSTCRVHPSRPSISDTTTTTASELSGQPSTSRTFSSAYKHRRLDCKATRTILVILTTYLVCWLPYVSVCITHLSGQCVPDPFETISVLLVYSSTSVNPVVYGFMNRAIREELTKYAYQIIRRQSVEDIRESEESRSQTLTTSTSCRKGRHCPDIWTINYFHNRSSEPKGPHSSFIMERILEEAENDDCARNHSNRKKNSHLKQTDPRTCPCTPAQLQVAPFIAQTSDEITAAN